uniref:Uncharacterized protein n=1 Tax=Candidatus Kentrum sp. FM TaxID=2126340 RepID=A0A450T5K4_9GAMM|nr:MAG: hypothetical protein BECKFM1743C_GA0114222_102817 [Candidatus Kentron sp. FM]VFJ61905.1 MAG: hypothetical protein BECKFM1743A_GA0114220_102953 [Candidatus Kentron sp. FM]VFK12830.1 MAG: hypothetical protein BECKFM1743B_GA0114221_102573 [Candidatus Kentron sp. FM]
MSASEIPSFAEAVQNCDEVVPKCPDAVLNCDEAAPKCDEAVLNCDGAVPKCPDAVPKYDEAVPNCDDTVPNLDGKPRDLDGGLLALAEAAPNPTLRHPTGNNLPTLLCLLSGLCVAMTVT